MDNPSIPKIKRSTPEHFWSKVDRSGGQDVCWEWKQARDKDGYGNTSYNRVRYGAHRLAAMLSGMEIEGLCVLHRCDNPPCCNPLHLFLGSIADNNRDAANKGRTAIGDRNGTRTKPERLLRGDSHWLRRNPEKSIKGEHQAASKLKDHQVSEIRKQNSEGISYSRLAIQYDVNKSTIMRVVLRRSWRHVPD